LKSLQNISGGIEKPNNHEGKLICHVWSDIRGFRFVRDPDRSSNASNKGNRSQLFSIQSISTVSHHKIIEGNSNEL
jgi:hypothetical protein